MSMKVYGYEIPAEVDAAIVERMRVTRFTLSNINGELDRRLPAEATPTGGRGHAHADRGDICWRAADRLIQRERKAGNIAIARRIAGSPLWEWCGPEAPAVDGRRSG
ncbi:hypothetical protein [Paraburkholderia sacchari]|uniref:hypothetical protein n=1 Tax=Paraburkholderia sacchari TaxID=159450 RepID=UPI001BCDB172|nr:hypothetical protein [Paraburkholderia sacchari]